MQIILDKRITALNAGVIMEGYINRPIPVMVKSSASGESRGAKY